MARSMCQEVPYALMTWTQHIQEGCATCAVQGSIVYFAVGTRGLLGRSKSKIYYGHRHLHYINLHFPSLTKSTKLQE